jgi:glycosyltransferase involved in cell wall biosynthesis
MRVLFQSRRNLFNVPGGDTTQIEKTAEFLEKKGVKVDVSTEFEPELSDYDLVHIFNLMRGQETYLQVFNAKRRGTPVALSTIYGLYTEYEKKASTPVRRVIASIFSPYQVENLKIFARAVKNREIHRGVINVLRKGYYRTLKEICNNIDIFLPNSVSEMNRIIKDFKLEKEKIEYIVVPNAVDKDLFKYEKTGVDKEIYGKYKDCILCVSRIEGRKSQLNLVRAIKGLPYKLVLIGKPAPNHIKYFEKIKKEGGDNVIFLGQISHEKLPQYYKVAKVHALISWMETPGLSSLEAAIMRCNIVITEKGDTRDYFGGFAYYCEPDNINSIRQAIVKAYNAPFKKDLEETIINNYTWEKTAEKTLEGYNKILRGK